ncbi:hypothetical protein ARMGADRAFT_555682 [Armillaria gallica]|uniref:Uncharacterized protein n=1 Tax=Armillaria gallica TaxID=47427 RepID=A0A2H3DE86_ARMGA|nr:hypothetical protein ARMGADRAFT_555682 [Armillaria gallica]
MAASPGHISVSVHGNVPIFIMECHLFHSGLRWVHRFIAYNVFPIHIQDTSVTTQLRSLYLFVKLEFCAGFHFEFQGASVLRYSRILTSPVKQSPQVHHQTGLRTMAAHQIDKRREWSSGVGSRSKVLHSSDYLARDYLQFRFQIYSNAHANRKYQKFQNTKPQFPSFLAHKLRLSLPV